jgi:hypothetical protein
MDQCCTKLRYFILMVKLYIHTTHVLTPRGSGGISDIPLKYYLGVTAV